MNKFDFGYKHPRTGNWFFHYFNRHWGVVDYSWADMETKPLYSRARSLTG